MMNEWRKSLSMQGLLDVVRQTWESTPTLKSIKNCKISIFDYLMSGLAIFILKFPSLLCYDQQKRKDAVAQNLRQLLGVIDLPSDTALRENLDELNPQWLRKTFKKIFALLQHGQVLKDYEYLNKKYLLSIDATGQYSSYEVYCSNCCERNIQEKINYYHQMLGAALVHPDQAHVFPLAPEPITKQDGQCKNDCERNACKRLLAHIRQDHPFLPLIVIEDGLSSNGPHIQELKKHKMSFILGAKEEDHKALFHWVYHSAYQEMSLIERDGRQRRYRWLNQAPLNDTQFDCEVNFLEYWEIPPGYTLKWMNPAENEIENGFLYVYLTPSSSTLSYATRKTKKRIIRGIFSGEPAEQIKEKIHHKEELTPDEIYWMTKEVAKKCRSAKDKPLHFSWVTDILLSKRNVYDVMRGGRARWKIENETFNTLKNQGYHFEHNFGHGNKNLCSVFTFLMMLVFLMDQVQAHCCSFFQAARQKSIALYRLWETQRVLFQLCVFESWKQFYEFIAKPQTLSLDSS